MANIRHSKPDYDLGFQGKKLKKFQIAPFLLGSGTVGEWVPRLPPAPGKMRPGVCIISSADLPSTKSVEC